MLLDICLGTRTSWKILFILGEAPGKAISRKDIQRFTKTGNKSLVKFLLILEKFDMIIMNRIGKIFYYKLNMANPFVEHILEIIYSEKKNLNNIDLFVMNMLREFSYEMTNINLDNIFKIILFGSYAKRTYSDSSDIDLAIILKKKNPGDDLLITEMTGRISERFRKNIQLHYFTSEEFDEQKKKEGLAREIFKDGIVLM